MKGDFVSIFFLVIVLSDVTLAADSVDQLNKDAMTENWKRLESKVKAHVDKVLKQILPFVVRGSAESNISAPCQGAIVRTAFAVRQLKGWAIKMLDAWGKPTSGMLEGTLSSLGSYPECLSTVAYQDGSEDEVMFRGQYCTIMIRPPVYLSQANTRSSGQRNRNHEKALHDLVKAIKKGEILSDQTSQFASLGGDHAMRTAVCTPSVCTKDDIQNMATLGFKEFDLDVTVSSCEVEEPKKLERYHIIALSAIGAFLVLAVIGTCVDVFARRPCWHREDNFHKETCSTKIAGFLGRLARCFSVYSNVPKFLDTSKKGSLSCLNGIRVISMLWILYGHTYFFLRNTQIYRSLLNGYDNIVNNIFFTPIINCTFGVETFFFISGLLVVYSYWPKLERNNGRMNVLGYLLHRISRLSPSLAITTILMVLLPLWGSGPFWKETIDFEVENCVQRGWMNMIFINNFVHYKQMCMTVTWYLASNMQVYVLGILFLVPIFRYPRLGLTIVACLAMIGMGVTAAITWIYDLAPGMMFLSDTKLLDEVVVKVYHKPWAHVGGFCVGAAVGYALRAKAAYRMRPMVQFLGWVSSAVLLGVLAYGVYEWNRGALPPTWLSALYASTHRTGWTIGVAWIVYMCATERAGLINTILSWSGFVPLANISYLCYLLHPLVIMYNVGVLKERIYYDHYTMAYMFFGHFVSTIMLATLCYVFVELPFTNLDCLLSSTCDSCSRKKKPAISEEPFHRHHKDNNKNFVARL